MGTTTSTHALVRAALAAAGLHVAEGPAHSLPLDDDGMVEQAVVMWPSPGLHQYTRSCGARSGRTDTVLLTCVGATASDALAVADRVEAAIGGLRTSSKGGTWRQTVATRPFAEPNTDPQRVSLAVEYSTITKG